MKKILALNGGGVRGLIEAMVLSEIETRLRLKLRKKVYLADYFDVISGASTGGILAAILSVGDKKGKYLYDCTDAVKFYKNHLKEIFEESKRPLGAFTYKYSKKALEKYLDKYFCDLELKDFKNHVIIPTVDMNTCQAYFFSNIKADNERVDYKIKDVLRCTSAAPTYFEPKKCGNVIGIDGGLVANNTAVCCIAKLQKYDDTPYSEMCILNIGSGSKMPNIKDPKKTYNLFNWATSIAEIMMYANIGLVSYQLNQLDLGRLFEIDVPEEYRIYSSDMADASNENVSLLTYAGYRTILHHTKYIDEIVKYLTN